MKRFIGLCLALLHLCAWAEDASELFPAGAHPRLLFSAEELPGLRGRLDHPALEGLVERVRSEVVRETDRSGKWSSILYDSRVRDHALLYAMTGDPEEAEACWERVLALLEDKVFWQNPRSKGLTRAYGALSVALAYDLCYDAWPEDRRKRVSGELLRISQGMQRSMGRGANTQTANNWQGVRYGAVLVAALACDEPEGPALAAKAYEGLIQHLKKNLGPSVWNPEGIGYLTYPWTFTGPAGIVARRAGLGDLSAKVPQIRETLWTQFAGTVPIPTMDGDRGLYGDLSDDNPRLGSRGTAGLAFAYLPEAAQGAARFAYDQIFPAQEFDTRWGGGLYTWLYYPVDTEPENPEQAGRLTFRDNAQGIMLFRNRWQDEEDIVALVNATARRAQGGHTGADVNTFRLQGLGGFFVTGAGRTNQTAGQTNLFPAGGPPKQRDRNLGKLREGSFDAQGGGHAVVTGSCMGVRNHQRTFQVDYSGRSGTPALFLNHETSENGRKWRINTPELNRIELRENQFWIHASNGSVLHGVVLEPAAPVFNTGTVERGGGAGHTGFPYRGTKYINNTWLEMEVEGRVAVAMTLQKGVSDAVTVQQGLHGAELRLGEVAIRYDRVEEELRLEDPGAPFEALERKTPLPPVLPRAQTMGSDAILVEWQPREAAAQQLRVERSVEGGDWTGVARVDPSVGQWLDQNLKESTPYRYRLVHENEFGDSQATASVEAATWSMGVQEWVEDFGPSDHPDANRLGSWRVVESPRPQLTWSSREGSERQAGVREGFYRTGHVPIRETRVLLLEDVPMDLSMPEAEVRFDIQARATTVFSPIFRLQDGSWVMAGRVYEQQKGRWKTITLDLQDPKVRWWRVNPEKRTREGNALKDFDPSVALQQVTGLGVMVEWVINQKSIALDQFTVRGRRLKSGK